MTQDLAAHIHALGMKFPAGVDRATAQLDGYLSLLLKWNRVYNLTAITDREQMITHHLLDSLSIVEVLDEVLEAKPHPKILDVGTGAGLPGVPVAIARPDWQLTLLDSNGKKTAFVTQAAAELGLGNVSVVTSRVESAAPGDYDVIVSRAYSSLCDFTTQTQRLLAPDGLWAAMKGSHPREELHALPPDIECVEVRPLAVSGLDAERHLVILKVRR